MELISDILLVAATLGASIYCVILSRRLRRFTDLEQGVGGAVAVLSAQVDDMSGMLAKAQESAETSTRSLTDLTEHAETVAKRLELLVASLHDLPEARTQEPDLQPARANGLFHSQRSVHRQAAE